MERLIDGKLKLISLFSGIGAFEKALDNIGIPYELLAYCDIDKYASRSYAAIHGAEESLNLGDITKVDEKNLPHNVDLLTYGFPCTDISIAGRQKGLFDDDGNKTRSGLFFDALRIIEEVKPRIAIAENVKNLTGKKFKEQFALVLKSLDDAGYNNYWKVLNLKDFGIPQNRERVFIVSVRKDIDNGDFAFPDGFPLQLALKDILEPQVAEKYFLSKKMVDYVTADVDGCGFGGEINPEIARSLTATQHKMHRAGVDNYVSATPPPVRNQVVQIGNCCPTKTRENPNQGRIYDTNGLAPALNCMGGGNRQPCVPAEPRIRKLTTKECFRLMGFSDDDHARAAAVNSNTRLYKQAGNSIGVPCLEHIFKNLMDCGLLEG